MNKDVFGVSDSLYFPKCPKVAELHSYIFNIVKTASPRESLVWPYRISANVPGPFYSAELIRADLLRLGADLIKLRAD